MLDLEIDSLINRYLIWRLQRQYREGIEIIGRQILAESLKAAQPLFTRFRSLIRHPARTPLTKHAQIDEETFFEVISDNLEVRIEKGVVLIANSAGPKAQKRLLASSPLVSQTRSSSTSPVSSPSTKTPTPELTLGSVNANLKFELTKRSDLVTLMQRIYARLFLKMSLDRAYRKFYRAPLIQSEDELSLRIRVCLWQILKDYHHNIKTYRGLPKAELRKMYDEMLQAIRTNEDADSAKNVVYEVHIDFIRANLSNGNCAQYALSDLHRCRQNGRINTDADLSAGAIFGKQEHRLWQDLYTYAVDEHKRYTRKWFQSDDRKQRAQAFAISLQGIHNSKGTYAEKVAELIELTNASSLAAINDDFEADKVIGKYNIFSYRNPTGSRYQRMLTHINATATTYAITQPFYKVDYHSEFLYLCALLTTLRERATLVKVAGHQVIRNIADDCETIQQWMSAIQVQNHVPSARSLALISERLKGYKRQLQRSLIDSNSKKAFAGFLSTVQKKLVKFKFTEEQIEFLRDEPRRHVYQSCENGVREALQTALRTWLENPQAGKRNASQIEESLVYAKLLKQTEAAPLSASAILAQQTLAIFHKTLKEYFSNPELKIEEAQFNEAEKRLGLRVSMQDAKGANYSLSLRVNTFDADRAKCFFAVCEWPLMQKTVVAVAPIPSKRLTLLNSKHRSQSVERPQYRVRFNLSQSAPNLLNQAQGESLSPPVFNRKP